MCEKCIIILLAITSRRNFYRKYGIKKGQRKEKGNYGYMVTLKDIAERAGVSSMTVSRVMNGKRGAVSQETSERIKKIAQEMGYVPNSSARALASRSSRLITALLQEYDEDRNPLEDSYTSCFLGELALQIKKEGYDLMLHYVKDYSEITYSLKSWNVAGAVFIGMFDESIRKLQENNHIPLIFTDSYSSVRSITNVITEAESWRRSIFLKTVTEMWRFTDRKLWTTVLLCTDSEALFLCFGKRGLLSRRKILSIWA